ncbi:bifunctional metallophosphatase/5'-nucleotidase [Nonomuraea sp. NPDC050663]|uniref:bifunctional metallophosphatase/5'-nucleotidase n=1 Tax=Nonomuraea sp. NPDC050663 TaxID=3364370 RepID=UPI0037A5EF5B
MTSRTLLRLAVAGAVAAGGFALASIPAEAAKPPKKDGSVRLLTINDFHGNLETPAGSSGRILDENGVFVQGTGGAAFLATAVKEHWAAGKTNVVASGDLIGASPLISAAYHDEPTVQILGKLGLDVSGVGNHEYDEGIAELRRIQNGGCHPVDGCAPAPGGRWRGAEFQYLAANVVDERGRYPIAPFSIKIVNGVKVGYIGLVTKTTPTIVTAEGIQGLTFQDEVEAGNRASKWLSKLGVKVQVALVHEGDAVAVASPDACPSKVGTAGEVIAKGLDAAVDVVVMGHSHQAYICETADPKGQRRVYTQGSSFGRVLTQIDFKVNPRTKDVDRASVVADNHVVATPAAYITNAGGTVNSGPYTGRLYAPDAAIDTLVGQWKTAVSAVANKQVGTITANIGRAPAASGEFPLGNLIADSQLAATKADGGAQIAFMNPGGVRTDLTFTQSGSEGDGVVTYGEAFAVQPFNNLTQVITLTGAELKTVLEQQFAGGPNNQVAAGRILQPSSNFTYSYSTSAAWGTKVSDMKIDGVPVTDTQTIKVAVNNFLVGGGDAFAQFAGRTDKSLWSGPLDIDAFVAYLSANSPVAPPAPTHITVLP